MMKNGHALNKWIIILAPDLMASLAIALLAIEWPMLMVTPLSVRGVMASRTLGISGAAVMILTASIGDECLSEEDP